MEIKDSPFSSLATGVRDSLKAAGLRGARIDDYEGEAEEKIRENVRQRGPVVMVRAVGAKQAQQKGPPSADCADVLVQIVAAAKSTAQRNAWSYAWAAFAILRNTTAGVTWLRSGLRFKDAAPESESDDCMIVSITMAGHADLGTWVEG